MMWYGAGNWGWMAMIPMLLFWMVLIVAAIWAVGALSRRGQHPEPPADPAVETVRRRYAQGEIDEAEYEERLRILNSSGRPPPIQR